MRNLYLLISPRFLGLRNRIRNSEKKGKKPLILLSLGLVFCGGLFFLSCRVLGHFQSIEVIGNVLPRYLLSVVLLTFFSLLVFSHIITALSNLYLSNDLEFCHSTPARLREIFISRAINTFLDSSWMLLVFGFPVFIAYAYVYKAGLGFFVTMIHMNLAMALIAAGIGVLLTMILVYVFPAQRTKDLVMLLTIFMVIGLYLMFRFLRPERLVNPESFFSVVQYISTLKASQSPYLPTEWVTKALWGSLNGAGTAEYMFEILLTWTTAGALVVIGVWTAGALYFDGFSKAQEAKRRRKGGRRILDALAYLVSRPFGQDNGGVVAKDIKTFFRDNTQWSQLLLLGALVIVYIYNFTVLPLHKSPIRLDFLQNQIAFFNLGLAGFVLSALSARFVYTAVSAEGEAYWILRSSPLGVKRYLWSKYLFFVLPMVVLGELLIVVTNYFLNVTAFMMVLSSTTMFFMVFGITALGVGFGASYPDFKHQNIAQVSTGYGGVLYMIVTAIFIAVVIILEAGPVYILFMSDVKGYAVSSLQWIFIVTSFLVVLAVNVVAVFKPMRMGLKALEAYE